MVSGPCKSQRLSWLIIGNSNSHLKRGKVVSAFTYSSTSNQKPKIQQRGQQTSQYSSFSINANNIFLHKSNHDDRLYSTYIERTVTDKNSQLQQKNRQRQCLSSSRNLSSNNGSNDKNTSLLSKETKARISQTGPVSLKNTSRAKASAKLISKHALHLPHINTNNITKTHSVPNLNHDSTHFVLGGTMCDPAPAPFRLADYGEESVYTLVLLRHGESEWNQKNLYTGWCDVPLTQKGKQEARDAGRLMRENNIEIDHAFTSLLKRANFTTNMALNTSHQAWVPVTKSWRLNERHYGALQGYNKDTAYEKLGIDQELVMAMRRSYDTRPPPMMDNHKHWHGHDRRYAKLSFEQLERTRGESLKDTADRIMPFFNTVILPSLKAGNKCLVVSHANTLRTLIKQIDNISDEDIKGMSIPTAIPILYRLDKNFKPVDPNVELEFKYMVEPKGYTWATSRAHGFHGVYLGDLERLQDIQKKRDATNRDWQRIIMRNLALALDPAVDLDVCSKSTSKPNRMLRIRKLWWQIHTKMHETEFSNMLILARMKDHLETLMYEEKQHFMSFQDFEKVMDQLHLDAEGHVVEPFVKLSEDPHKEERVKQWYDSMAMDLEEECLIK